jgi:hypothetical protein
MMIDLLGVWTPSHSASTGTDWLLLAILTLPFAFIALGWTWRTIEEIGFWRFLLRLLCRLIVFPLALCVFIGVLAWPFFAIPISFVSGLVLLCLWLPLAWRLTSWIPLVAFYWCIC